MAQLPGTSTPSGSPSISNLVQQLQTGNISKQQLYEQLTNMYKGQTNTGAGGSNSLLGSPSSSLSSSFSHSLSLQSDHAPLNQSFSQPAQQQQQFNAFQPVGNSQQQPFQQPPPTSFLHPSSSLPLSSSPQQQQQHQLAQQQVQAFLSRHQNQIQALNQSKQQNAGNLDLSIGAANNHSNTNASLNFSHFASSHPPIYSSPATNTFPGQQNRNEAGGANISFSLGGGSNMSGLDTYEAGNNTINQSSLQFSQSMNDSMQQQGGGGDNAILNAHEHLAAMHQAQQQQYNNDGAEAEEYLGANTSLRHQHQQQQQRQYQQQQSYARASARASVRERMAQVYTDEKNKELTFHPEIHPIPRNIYSKSRPLRSSGSEDDANEAEDEANTVPFLDRAMHWHEHKKARERQLSLEQEKKQLNECTFHPSLTKESISIVEAPGATHRRLFSARSTARAKILELEVKRKEEEEFRNNCTFEPNLNRKSLELANTLANRKPLTAAAIAITPASPNKQLTAGSSNTKVVGISTREDDLKECTFQPKTNSVPRQMLAAQAYLEQDTFQRLSSMKSKKKKEEDGYESDTTNSRGGRSRQRPSSASAAHGRRSSSGSARLQRTWPPR